ncbi:MAG: hypothetical protein K8S20_08430 [Chloroflexi bacterium]|nr:hypothetical protein [Chloroflexota bacterium]
MDNNLVLILVIFGLGCLAFIFFLVIFIGAMIFFFRTASSTVKKMNTRPEKEGEEYLASAALREWGPDAWADLSSRWEGWWLNTTGLGRSDGYTQGVVASLQDPKGPGWMAFTLERHQARNGPVILKTSRGRIELKVTSKSVADKNIQVVTTVDGVEDGSIAVTYPNCLYRSKDGTLEARWVAEWRWNKEKSLLNRLTSREVNYDKLTVNGREIAAITDTWIRNPHPESTRPIHPALQSISRDLSGSEENVLLIALGLALYYDSLRNRQGYFYDW